jgi:hypothetical protein
MSYSDVVFNYFLGVKPPGPDLRGDRYSAEKGRKAPSSPSLSRGHCPREREGEEGGVWASVKGKREEGRKRRGNHEIRA